MKIIINKNPWNKHAEIAVVDQQVNGYARELIMQSMVPQGLVQPAFNMHSDDLQDLFNQLWTMGYRPADGTGNAGHVAALEAHLQDMRVMAGVTTHNRPVLELKKRPSRRIPVGRQD